MQIKLSVILLLLAPVFVSASSVADKTSLYFVSPRNGTVVDNPVTVVFGLSGPYVIVPAGVVQEFAGHHHLLIDTELPDLALPIPNNENHRHFGGGQTEVVLELSPGEHRLQLLLGDFAHIPHKPPVISEPIKITVRE
ncbi:MAG TPA: rod shape-determining protein RodA [Gammaproteobacteria bacterium]|nr:rod shape-determining protein RodA [Gammaproteobacteria bacterium]